MALSFSRSARRLAALLGLAALTVNLGASCPPQPCPGGAPCGVPPLVLQPSNVLASGHANVSGCDFGPGGLGGEHLSAKPGEVVVGFDHGSRGSRLLPRPAAVCDEAIFYYRGGVRFDQGAIASFIGAHGLLSAELAYTVTGTEFRVPGPSKAAFTCIAALATATVDWRGWHAGDNNPIPYENPVDLPYLIPAPTSPPGISLSIDANGNVVAKIDVSAQVRAWFEGSANNGFVLAGKNETDAPDDALCDSHAQAFTLTLLAFHR